MEIINETKLSFAPLVGKLRHPVDSLSFIIKGTFLLAPGKPVTLAEEPEPVTGDEFEGDDPAKSILYAGDFIHFKPCADLVLTGTCYPAGKKPVTVSGAAFRVASWKKEIVVVGDRRWKQRRLLPPKAESPAFFKKMPLLYENGFGGKGFGDNPVGKGFKDGQLPNIEMPRDLIQSMNCTPSPAGFGPVSSMWKARTDLAGTYDDEWKEKRWPWFPKDIDWHFFNSAPKDQQLPGFLRGDEELQFTNLHAEHPDYSSRLPGLRVRCIIRESHEGAERFRDIPLNLDTLQVNMDEEKLFLVWRGTMDIRTEEHPDLLTVMIFAEPMSEAPKPVSHYREIYLEKRREHDKSALEKLEGACPAAIPPAAPAPPPCLPEMIERRQSLAGMDLTGVYLAGANLAAMDLSDCILAGAHLTGANLMGSNLSGATLAGADLTKANLIRANLAGADLTGARLDRSELNDANLEGADFTSADLREIRAKAVRAKAAIFVLADLTDACLRDSDLEKARIEECTLDATDLSNANLAEASLAKNFGRRTIFEKAKLQKAKLNKSIFTDGYFVQIQAPESIWEGSFLYRCNLTEAVLSGAEFTMANAEGACFRRADLRAANLVDAVLKGACLSQVNGFQSCFQKADLTGADCSHSNFYSVEFCGARLEGADFRNSNMKKANIR